MRAPEFQSLASAAYGPRWQSRLARDTGIALRTIQRWTKTGIVKSDLSERIRQFLEERRIARIAAPPGGTSPDQDRDDDCYSAVEPGIATLIATAETAGWEWAEIVTAVIAITGTDALRRIGQDATIDLLQSAIDEIRDRQK